MNFTKLFSECAKGNYAYSPMTRNETKRYRIAHFPKALSELVPCISQEIIIQNEKKFDSFYLEYVGWIKTKNHLTLLSL